MLNNRITYSHRFDRKGNRRTGPAQPGDCTVTVELELDGAVADLSEEQRAAAAEYIEARASHIWNQTEERPAEAEALAMLSARLPKLEPGAVAYVTSAPAHYSEWEELCLILEISGGRVLALTADRGHVITVDRPLDSTEFELLPERGLVGLAAHACTTRSTAKDNTKRFLIEHLEGADIPALAQAANSCGVTDELRRLLPKNSKGQAIVAALDALAKTNS